MKRILATAIIIATVLSPRGMYAQGGSSPPPPAVSGPIDTGAFVLLIVVAGYGYFKIKANENLKG